MEDHVEKARNFLGIGFQYLDLSQKVALEIAKSGNVWMFVQEGTDFERMDKEYEEAVYWSDHKLVIPVLFNFYHGVELMLKGLLLLSKDEFKNHKLSAMLEKTKEHYNGAEFINYLEKYISRSSMPDILQLFFDISSMKVDEWYQALKYPESMKGKKYAYSSLKY